MTLVEYLEQYDDLVPYMDEESRELLARAIQSGEAPQFNPIKLAQWVQLSLINKQQKKAFWKKQMEICKTKEASK